MALPFLFLPFTLPGLAPHLLTRNRIHNATRTARPGKSVTLQGTFGAAALVFMSCTQQLLPVQLPANIGKDGTVAQREGSVTVRIPRVYQLDEYQLWVQDGAFTSNPVYVNRPVLHYANCPEFVGGGWHELHGKNLQLTPGVGTLTLTPQDGVGAPLQAVVDTVNSTSLYLRYQVPDAVSGGKLYRPGWQNGYGLGYQAPLEEWVRALTPGPDYLGVGDRVPNAVSHRHAGNSYDFGPTVRDSRLPASYSYQGQTVPLTLAGDRSTSDSRAINAAMAFVNAQVVGGVGGGRLRLLKPAGTGAYLVTETLDIPSAVSLEQAPGAFLTVPTTGGNGKVVYRSINTTRPSLINPQFSNPSTPTTAVADIWKTVEIRGTTGCIIKGGTLNLNDSTWVNLQGNLMLSHLDSAVSQGAAAQLEASQQQRGPVSYNGCARLIVNGLTINSTIDAMDVTFVNGFTVQSCTMTWNGALGNKQNTVSHFWAIGGSTNAYMRLNNGKAVYDAANPKTVDRTFRKIDPNKEANDGEYIIAERGGSEPGDNICGQVTGSSATSLTCQGVDFSKLTFPTPLVLVAGLGSGQYVTATSGTADGKLTISGTWDVQPDSSTRFTTCTWTLDRCNLEKNKVEDAKRGILLYYAHCREVSIVGNQLIRSGSIDLAPKYARAGDKVGVGAVRLTVMLAPHIEGNLVDWRGDTGSGSSGAKQAGGISLHPNPYVQNVTFGTMLFCPTVVDNTVLGDDTNRLVTVDAYIEPGIVLYDQFQGYSEKYIDNPDIPLIVGAVVEGNTVRGCKWGVMASSGVHNAYIGDNTLSGNGTNVQNLTLDGCNSPARNFVDFNTTA